MKVYNNIDLVQINIKAGVDEYYLPKNVNWRDRVVDKIVLALAPISTTMYSPIDGQTQVLDVLPIAAYNLFFDLYSADDQQIARNLSFENLLATNNHVLEIGSQLSLNLSRLFFTNTPASDGCILLYVFYGSKETEYEPTTKSVTVTVPLEAGGKMSLQDIVDNYILLQPETLKGMYVWDSDATPVYVTLRDKDGFRTLNSIYSGLMRPPIIASPGDARKTQIYEFRTDNLRIDMLNSFVRNAQNGNDADVKITFNY